MVNVVCGAFPFLWEELPVSPEFPDDEELADLPPADGNGQLFAPLRAMSLNILADGLARGEEESLEPPSSPSICPPEFEEYGAGGVVYSAEATKSAAGQARQASRAMSFTFRCRASDLTWSRRWPVLRSMILELRPDIIGLQEVDLLSDTEEGLVAHDKEIKVDLNKIGYRGSFARKTGRACDGVGLFWRAARLSAVGKADTWRLGSSVHVALAQPLLLDGALRFTAVCTHLKAGLVEEAESMRATQAAKLLQFLDRHTNAVVLADLNAHCRQTLVAGRPHTAHSDELLEPRAYPLLTGELRSAYKEVLSDEPNYTCWGGWSDREVRLVCDYILLKGDLFQPRRVLQVPTVEDVTGYAERLPNPDYPTDHVPLVADLAICAEEVAAAAPRFKKRGKQGAFRQRV